MSKTLAFDGSKCFGFVESKCLARNKGLLQAETPYVISSVVRAHFNCLGFFRLDIAELSPWFPTDRYLRRVSRDTWLIGGEYREVVETQDRIIAGLSTSETTYFPDEASYLAAQTTVNEEDNTVDEHSATHIRQVFGGSGTPYPEYYQFEQTLSEVNTYESCCETCAALLATPNIDGDVIGTDFEVRYLGNDGDEEPPPGYSLGDIYVAKTIPTYDGTLPISTYDQGNAIPGRYDYTVGVVQRIEMWRSKVLITGPTCRTFKRFVNPIETAGEGAVVKCVPFAVSESDVQTIYLNPPCKRGMDFWLDDLWQERTGTAPSECALSGTSGADPDCSLS